MKCKTVRSLMRVLALIIKLDLVGPEDLILFRPEKKAPPVSFIYQKNKFISAVFHGFSEEENAFLQPFVKKNLPPSIAGTDLPEDLIIRGIFLIDVVNFPNASYAVYEIEKPAHHFTTFSEEFRAFEKAKFTFLKPAFVNYGFFLRAPEIFVRQFPPKYPIRILQNNKLGEVFLDLE